MSQTLISAPSALEPEAISPRRRTAVLVTMLLALVLVVAGVSMMNVSLSTLTAALGASPTDQQWIVDGYTVALAALLLPAGAIGDRFGRRRALVAGIAIFGLASAASALTDSASALIVWRVLTGVGAALIMPGTLSTITSVFPAEGRAKAVGVWAGFAGAGGILGMLVGGALLEQWWWGSIFVVSSVLAAVALVATILTVPESRESEHVGVDPLGAVLSVLAIGGLVLGIIEGPSRGWSDPITLVGILGGIVAGFLFVWWELRTPSPLLDPRLFKLRGFATGSTSLFLQFFAIFGFFFISLQYLQLVLGYGTLKSALALLPIAVVMMPLSTVAASLAEQYGQRLIGSAGLLISAVGFVVIATMNAGSGYWELLAALLIIGGGTALAMTPATNAIVGSLPRAKQGVASAVNDTARELGSAFGIAILGSAFNSGYRSNIDGNLQGLPPAARAAAHEAPAAAIAVAHKAGASGDALVVAARDAFMVGSRYAMYIGAVLLVVGAVFVFARGQHQVVPEEEDTLDDELTAMRGEQLAELRPALALSTPGGGVRDQS
ncbi:MAG: multidrug transporter [Actinomycetia bacterium]|jgi:EmrB/QacA subfamily drug resistance transporter|nr:multidrug transporter [Actinomycetes bacterium]